MSVTLWELHAPGRGMLAWLHARPSYCDRGRWEQGFVVGFWKSEADWGQRYYFNLDAAKSETLAYLKAKNVAVDDATWEPAK